MKLCRSIFIRLMRFFSGAEASERSYFFIESNLRLVGFPFKPRMEFNSFESSLVLLRRIGAILPVRSFSQIFKSIVRSNIIFVIDLIDWQHSGDVEPCESVSGVANTINFYSYVPLSNTPSQLPGKNFWSCGSPSKFARRRIVRENFSQILKSYFFHKFDYTMLAPPVRTA